MAQFLRFWFLRSWGRVTQSVQSLAHIERAPNDDQEPHRLRYSSVAETARNESKDGCTSLRAGPGNLQTMGTRTPDAGDNSGSY